MITKQLLHKLKAKHPEYTEEEIKSVISMHLRILALKLAKSETFKLSINKLGTIHTHGNAVSKHKITYREYHRKNMRKVNDFSDKTLLF